jgi:hypothetical protein
VQYILSVLTQKLFNLKKFFSQTWTALKPWWIQAYFVVSSTSSWHLSFEYEEYFSSTSGNFAFFTRKAASDSCLL